MTEDTPVESDGLQRDKDWQKFKNDLRLDISFWVNGIIIPIICLFGIAGNVVCIFIFHKKDVELKPSFANLLKCLSIYDIIFLVCVLLIYCAPQVSVYYTSFIMPYVDCYIFPCTHIALTGSVYTTIGVAVERFITVSFPFTRCQMSDGFGYIIPITLFSVLYNAVKFFEMETVYFPVEKWHIAQNGSNISSVTFYPRVKPTSLRMNHEYSLVFISFVNNVIMGLLPIVLLSILNFLIYRAMTRAAAAHNIISSSQRRDSTMARLLMAIVFVFLSCHITRFFLNTFEAYEMVTVGELSSPFWILILVDINHILLSINSAINIVIYSFKDFKFRKILMKFLRKKPSLQPPESSSSSRQATPSPCLGVPKSCLGAPQALGVPGGIYQMEEHTVMTDYNTSIPCDLPALGNGTPSRQVEMETELSNRNGNSSQISLVEDIKFKEGGMDQIKVI